VKGEDLNIAARTSGHSVMVFEKFLAGTNKH
jgi:hypothetical protein